MIRPRKRTISIFILAQSIIVLLFALVEIVTLDRLNEAKNVLLDITQESVPIITKASSLNNQIQSLAGATSQLANASNTPTRLDANRHINNTFAKINESVLNKNSRSEFVIKQLYIVNIEIEELNRLVNQRITTEHNLVKEIRRLNVELTDFLNNKNKLSNTDKFEGYVFELLLFLEQIDRQTRLSAIRNLQQNFKDEFISVYESINNNELRKRISLLEDKIVGDDGLIDMKVNTLRLIGRIRGRDNFVRNLINDVASNLQYQSQLINQLAIERTVKATNNVNKQTQFAVITGIVVIVITVFIIYFLYRKIVLRLISLAQQVKAASHNQVTEVKVGGFDEISELASAFNLYLGRVREQEQALLALTLSDPLTGIANRRAFNQAFQDAINMARRHRWYLTVLLIDVDYFKDYNDYYGHTEGDKCLKKVANVLHNSISRETDFCARYGGEEFVCLLPNTDPKGAMVKANSLKREIENAEIEHNNSNVSSFVTASIGVATYPFSIDAVWSKELILEQADKALYKAKDEGRNRCEYYVEGSTNSTLE